MGDGGVLNKWGVSAIMLANALVGRRHRRVEESVPAMFRAPDVPEATISKDQKRAVDESFYTNFAYMNSCLAGYDGMGFMGYPLLAELSQRPEYRSMVGTLAEEMLREGFELVSEDSRDEKVAERIKELREEVKRFRISALLQKLVELDGFFGRCHVFVDTGEPDEELKLPLIYDKKTVKKGSLRGFRHVEPVWTYPLSYNSTDPLRADFYVPQTWTVMQREVHRKRLLTFVSREVPDILKPAYSFGGLSMTQLARPYVDNWLRTRDSVGDTVHSFSLNILKTNMMSTLQGGVGQELFNRVDLFNAMRDNRGAMVVDKDTEEVEQINTPLSGLADLQSQAQEQLCGVSRTPVVKLWGITPHGFNASNEGEMVAWEDYTAGKQRQLDNILGAILTLLQLNRFGDVEPSIKHSWLPLRQMDNEALSRIRKTTAEAHQIYEGMGAVSNEEVRAVLAADADSGYQNLDPEEMPEPPEDPLSEGDSP